MGINNGGRSKKVPQKMKEMEITKKMAEFPPPGWTLSIPSKKNIINCLNRAIKNPEMNPKCFTQDITYLLLKSNKINKPKSYYVQMLTSIITERT